MDKKSGKAMEKYYKSVARNIESMAPWATHNKRKLLHESERGKLVPGQLVVKLGPNDDPNSPLFRNAEMI